MKLEEVCFTYILENLEHFPVSTGLALLPAKLRRRLLEHLPVVDVCLLEETEVVSGLDMEEVWRELYKDILKYRFCVRDRVSIEVVECGKDTWKRRFLTAFCSILLWDARLYRHEPSVDSHSTFRAGQCYGTNLESNSVFQLVAMKVTTVDHNTWSIPQARMQNHSVLVPSSSDTVKLGCKCCFVPRRYAHLFPGRIHFLPNTTIIKLITEKCGFHPTEVEIILENFRTFLKHAEREQGNWSALRELLRDVECVVLKGKSIESINNYLLGLLLNPTKLTLLSLISQHCTETVIDSVYSPLTTFISGVKELHVESDPLPSTSIMQKLIAIAEHQSHLERFSVHINSLDPVQVPYDHVSLVNYYWSMPALTHLSITDPGHRIPITDIQKILLAFLSSPCSHDQTLTLEKFNLLQSKSVLESHDHPPRKHTLKYKSLVLKDCTNPRILLSEVSLKQLKIIAKWYCIRTIAQFAELIHSSREIHLTEVNLEMVTVDAYKLLLRKPSLQVLHLEHCHVKFVKLVPSLSVAVSLEELVVSDQRFVDHTYLLYLNLFPLPQLPKLSLKYNVPLNRPEVRSMISAWKENGGGVQMTALEVQLTYGESDDERFGREELEALGTMALGVKIQYSECVPQTQTLHIRFH